MGFFVGKSAAAVRPTRYTFLLLSTATPPQTALSLVPEMYVEKITVPEELSLTTYAAVPLPSRTGGPGNGIPGKFVEPVLPQKYVLRAASSLILLPLSSPLPPKYVENIKTGSMTSGRRLSYAESSTPMRCRPRSTYRASIRLFPLGRFWYTTGLIWRICAEPTVTTRSPA